MHMQRLKNFIFYVILLAISIATNPIFGEEPVTRTETLSFNEVVLELPSNNLRTLPVSLRICYLVMWRNMISKKPGRKGFRCS